MREVVCPVCQRRFFTSSSRKKYCNNCAVDVLWLQRMKAQEKLKLANKTCAEAHKYAGGQCHGRNGSTLNADNWGYMPYIKNPVITWRR